MSQDATLSDTEIKFSFPFIVKGDKPVKIAALEPYCACLGAKTRDGKFTYAAQEKGAVEVTFALANFSGRIEKHLGVKFAGEEPEQVLRPSVNIPEAYSVGPAHLKWELGEANAAKKITVTARS